MFSMARHLHDSNRQMPGHGASEFKALKKKYAKGIELRGKTLGIIGFGRIGQALAKYALGAGMHVIANDGYNDVQTVELEISGVDSPVTVNIKRLSIDELLKTSDFVSLHVPKQADGSAVIGASEFDMMKDGAFLVNAARGGVVDENALIAALDSSKLAYAALDVFDNEPTPRHDLMVHERIALTPHIGAATVEAQDRIGTELADKIIEYFK
jgi:D-3-phosphoglycerate dehydrogenase